MLNKILLILPLVLFFLLLFAFNYIGLLKNFNAKLKNYPIVLISLLVAICFIASLIFFSFSDGYNIKSKYIPPYLDDGKLIKGKFE